MRASWLFLVFFLVYWLGPVRVPTGPGPAPSLGPWAAAPFERLVRTIYPTADSVDVSLRASRLAGAAWTAGAVALTFSALQHLASASTALLLSLLTAFASPLWSFASRSDAPQAPAAFAVAAFVFLAARRPHASPVGRRAGDLASGALAVTLILLDATHPAAPLALLLFVRVMPWTRSAAALSAAGAATAALAAILGLPHWREAWATVRFSAPDLAGLAVPIVSPGRGVLLFVPTAILAVAALVRGDGPRCLVRGGAITWLVVLVEAAALGTAPAVLGFGPAALAAYVPLLAAMAAGLPALAVRWATLAALPVAVAHAGAVFLGGHPWDERRDPGAHPDALWDLRDTPFSDLLVGPPRPDVTALVPSAFPMAPGEHPTTAGQAVPWLLYGWEAPEPTGIWASGRESWIVAAVPPGDYVLTLMATAPRLKGLPQRLRIEAPGVTPVELAFGDGLWNVQPVTLHFRPQAGVAVIKLRPAHTWSPGRGDVRRLSFFATSIWLERVNR